MHATRNAGDLAIHLQPLLRFYVQSGEGMPRILFIEGESMPEPYRHLLVHRSDMTPRLSDFYQSEIGLEVLRKDKDSTRDELTREVILRRSDGVPVEFGAIRILIHRLPEPVAEEVRAGERPLGGILQSHRLPHTSAPQAYFQVAADSLMAQMLACDEGTTLYGRCNVLSLPDDVPFAEIVEILPPANVSESTVET